MGSLCPRFEQGTATQEKWRYDPSTLTLSQTTTKRNAKDMPDAYYEALR